jgi:glycosyltransferase involved in cell wall biosynthesis
MIVCPEPLGQGQPAGIGIRVVEIARVLLADGHDVTILSRDGGAVGGCAAEVMSPESIKRVGEESDVAIAEGHTTNEVFSHAPAIPTVVDLYDPYIIENLHYFGERGPEVFNHDHTTLMLALQHGDFFLCASSAQRLFYIGLLLAAGRVNPIAFEDDPRFESLLAIAPFGVPAPRVQAKRAQGAPQILFGGIYDWYDPITAIDAVDIARDSLPGLTLTFSRHPNPGMTPQGKTAEAMEYVKKRKLGSVVRFEPWAPYDARAAFFDRFTAALLTFPQSIETDLAMRTRVFDYLWGGLPIVTSSAPGTDGLIARYDAGAIVTGDARAYAQALVDVVRHGERHIAGARAFTDDHQWSRTLEPLRAFCRKPKRDGEKDAFAVTLQSPQRPPSILARIKRRIGAAF